MTDGNPIKYTGNVLDQRTNLTGRGDAGKADYPKPPKHVQIQQTKNNNEQ